jgi:hypothetical protein
MVFYCFIARDLISLVSQTFRHSFMAVSLLLSGNLDLNKKPFYGAYIHAFIPCEYRTMVQFSSCNK